MKTITVDEPLNPKMCTDELIAASRDAGHEGWVLARQHTVTGRWHHVPDQDAADSWRTMGSAVYRVVVAI